MATYATSRGAHEVVRLNSDLFEQAHLEMGFRASETKRIFRDIEASDLDGFTMPCFIAGLSNDPLNPALYEINHIMMHLANSKTGGITRFIFFISCSNYGAAGDDF